MRNAAVKTVPKRLACTVSLLVARLSSSLLHLSLIHIYLNIPYISDVIKMHVAKYRNRNIGNSNNLINELLNPSLDVRRLKRQWPDDLTR